MGIVYEWSADKNNLLILSRGVSFEEVVVIIEEGNIFDIIAHPNSQKYPTQKMYVLPINSYTYLVPFVQDNIRVFLKTIIPNRQAHKKYYLSRNNGESE